MNKGKAKQKEETKKGQSAAAQVSNDPISVRRSQKARKRKEKKEKKRVREKKKVKGGAGNFAINAMESKKLLRPHCIKKGIK